MVGAIAIQDVGKEVQFVPSTRNGADPRQFSPVKKETQQSNKVDGSTNAAANQINQEKAQKYTDSLNQVMEALNQSIRFDLDKNANRLVVKIVDRQTNEVIRQIPPEDMLQLKHKIDEMVGLILDEKV